MGAHDTIDLTSSFLPTPGSASNIRLSFSPGSDVLTISDTVNGTLHTDTLTFSGAVPGTFSAAPRQQWDRDHGRAVLRHRHAPPDAGWPGRGGAAGGRRHRADGARRLSATHRLGGQPHGRSGAPRDPGKSHSGRHPGRRVRRWSAGARPETLARPRAVHRRPSGGGEDAGERHDCHPRSQHPSRDLSPYRAGAARRGAGGRAGGRDVFGQRQPAELQRRCGTFGAAPGFRRGQPGECLRDAAAGRRHRPGRQGNLARAGPRRWASPRPTRSTWW